MKVGVLIRCKNSAWVIDQTLAALFSQEGVEFEVTVVDSGSKDATLEMLARYPVRLHQVEAGDYYPGAILNQFIPLTAGEVVVLLNSDCVLLGPRSLANLLRAFDDPEVAAAFGRQVARPEAYGWVRVDYARSFPERGPAPEWQYLSLPIAAMRRSAWQEQPFYTDAWGSEDTEWGMRARRRGWKVAYVPLATAMHSHNYSLKELYGRSFIEGEADAFMEPRPRPEWRWLAGFAGLCARDLWRLGWRGLTGGVYRAVRQWGLRAGNRWGWKRRREQNFDRSYGQQVVLSSQPDLSAGR